MSIYYTLLVRFSRSSYTVLLLLFYEVLSGVDEFFSRQFFLTFMRIPIGHQCQPYMLGTLGTQTTSSISEFFDDIRY